MARTARFWRVSRSGRRLGRSTAGEMSRRHPAVATLSAALFLMFAAAFCLVTEVARTERTADWNVTQEKPRNAELNRQDSESERVAQLDREASTANGCVCAPKKAKRCQKPATTAENERSSSAGTGAGQPRAVRRQVWRRRASGTRTRHGLELLLDSTSCLWKCAISPGLYHRLCSANAAMAGHTDVFPAGHSGTAMLASAVTTHLNCGTSRRNLEATLLAQDHVWCAPSARTARCWPGHRDGTAILWMSKVPGH